MSFNLDLALFYAYTLGVFSFLLFWLVPKLFRAVIESLEVWIQSRDGVDGGPESRPSHPPQTRLEAFTRT